VGEVECPPPDEDKEERKGKRGPIKRSKARNLLERLINYEDEVLGFMHWYHPKDSSINVGRSPWIAKFNASVALTPCLMQVEI
jgi:hypothetical protein